MTITKSLTLPPNIATLLSSNSYIPALIKPQGNIIDNNSHLSY